MKAKPIILALLFVVPGCGEEISNNKNLEQNMMGLRIYQENLGDHIKSKNLYDASWLLEGMDSILPILNGRFKEHPKPDAPFSLFY